MTRQDAEGMLTVLRTSGLDQRKVVSKGLKPNPQTEVESLKQSCECYHGLGTRLME